ncbi:MAG: hypothetical protein LC749_02490 [Actinobacteria bacterium]|nr:hypothetical protein [Actinomycetota bacterium]
MSETAATPDMDSVLEPVCCDERCPRPFEWMPPLDHAPVLAAYNKLTVLLMNAVEKDSDEPAAVADLCAEDREVHVYQSDARWLDVRDALEGLAELVGLRAESGRLVQHLVVSGRLGGC